MIAAAAAAISVARSLFGDRHWSDVELASDSVAVAHRAIVKTVQRQLWPSSDLD